MSKTDKELLELGRLAVAMHAAWVERNAARSALRTWRLEYTRATGEWFDRLSSEPEDEAAFAPINARYVDAKRRLAAARRSTHRAAASIGEKK